MGVAHPAHGRNGLVIMLCLVPVLLIGVLLPVSTSWHTSSVGGGAMIEVQSCDRGLGVQSWASSDGLYGMGAQYGLQYRSERASLTLTPSAGLSYVDHAARNLPQRVQFVLGLQAVAGWEDYRVSVGYRHLSNAGLTSPNVGEDLLSLQVGQVFQLP